MFKQKYQLDKKSEFEGNFFLVGGITGLVFAIFSGVSINVPGVIGGIAVFSVCISYGFTYRLNFIQCVNCELIYYTTIQKTLSNENTFYDIIGGMMYHYCERCRPYL